jgi:cysteinyl-tRNA synthetase
VSGHYRQPLGFSEEALEQAAANVRTLRELVRRLEPGAASAEPLDALVERFFDALADDFNTPEARAVLFEWAREANRRLDAGEVLGPGRLREMLYALGLERLLDGAADEAPDDVRALADRREAARAARDFAAADRLRDELAERGWEVRDTPDGARLVRSR